MANWRNAFACFVASCAAWSAAAFGQEVIPDFYKDPGLYPNRSYVNQHVTEHIDPFTGALQLHSVDIHLPGNGGFDLKVVRSYNSASIDSANPAAYESLAGLGWTVHFGRVLKAKQAFVCTNQNALSVADNPVLELPDGSRQLLAFTGGTSPLMLTSQWWKADCFGSGLAVYSPDGTRYDMTQPVNVGTQLAPVYAWYTTKITDRNGNYATIAYAGATQQIAGVSTSDGRSIAFVYADSGLATRRISSITAAGQTYTYGYQAVTGFAGLYQLASVTRPDGRTWNYAYNGNLNGAAGSYLMSRVTYPQGGQINYGYAYVYFDSQANPLSRTAVVATKSVSTGGNWTFTYQPGGPGTLDTTTANTPAGTIVYRHVGPNYSSSGTVWMVGLLISRTIGTAQTESYTWGKLKISSENYFRPGAFVTKIDSGATNAPVLTARTITRDGATYATAYSGFDGFGNPGTIGEAGPNGGNRTTQVGYYVNTAKWFVKQVQDEVGASTVDRTFDGNGNLLAISRDGVSTSYTYDSQGNVSTATFPRGLLHQYSNYKRGVAQTENQPEGVNLARTVSDAGNVSSQTNGEGFTTSYGYDGLNRVTSVSPPVGNAVAVTYGATTRQATRGGLVETTGYDGFGNTVSVVRGGIARTFTVDALGRTTFASNPGSGTQGDTVQYDILGRPTLVTHADATRVRIAYGPAGKTVTDERGFATSYSYRAYGDPDRTFAMAVSAPEPSASLTLQRDSRDRVTSITQGGLTRTYGYSGNNYLTTVYNPETGTTIYGRDAAGNMTSRSVGAAGTTSYGYDGQNRLTSVTYTGAAAVTHAYDRAHRITRSTSAIGNRTYAYDGNGNLLSDSLGIGDTNVAITYAYDANDHLGGIGYPLSGRSVLYSPDALGRPTKMSGIASTVTYWPNGQLNQVTYANSVSVTYDQNSRLLPSALRVTKSGTSLANASYAWDGAGNLTSIVDTQDAAYNRTLRYDGLNRLTGADTFAGTGTIGYTATGNIAQQSYGPVTFGYAYDASNRLSSIGGTFGASYAYDAWGDVVAAGANTFTYDGVPNLVCANCANAAKAVNYIYDASNQRLAAKRNGVVTIEIHDREGRLLVEFTPANGRLVEHFYLGERRVAQAVGGGAPTTYLHNDLAGSPVLATDAAGLIAWKENYLPFGYRLSNPSNAADNPSWFAGKQYEAATGLSYFGARYYDPLIGRFMGVDPKGVDPNDLHSFNRYAYANNNPYRYVDLDGRNPIAAAGALGVGLVGIGIASQLSPEARLLMVEGANRVLQRTSELLDRATGLIFNEADNRPIGQGTGSDGQSADQKDVTKRPSRVRKGTEQANWDNAQDGENGSKLCPTCGREVSSQPGEKSKDWDNDHIPPWRDRDLAGKDRKGVLDEYNTGTRLRCVGCNRSDNGN
ncbi:MAG TPA: RHS repeat-associated core domain-containing protein [Ramlibacter sp.]|uniref:RHS repeat-associated core domain-containing protein n=1 Tax=Ramlibacter sp. TaxID=1917967 RepID=UPI002D0745A1|nr:RHS repeat-associated core domain-containing protein [Ramlibacter sp.]HVZ45441.1 RHS repeat-associated core domain-containing protein [Ramlibacter sp.]